MTGAGAATSRFGREVLGPVVAEFCLRLWLLAALFDRPADTAFLFCARGGLRLEECFNRFLASTGQESPLLSAPLMVSRLVAMRAALVASLDRGDARFPDGAAGTLAFEFGNREVSVADVAYAISGVRPPGAWDMASTADGLMRLLHHDDGGSVVESMQAQTALFRRHLDETRAGRSDLVLVDTGLHGTTALLLDEAFPDLRFSSALLASYFPPWRDLRGPRTSGLSLETGGYAPWMRRSVLLRYWHLVEWLFEPSLPSVRSFHEHEGSVVSNLQLDGWARHIEAEPGSLFAGVLDYLAALPAGPGSRVTVDAPRAWRQLRRSVVFPTAQDASVLTIANRSHDFGRDETFGPRTWTGLGGALRGAAMWREGEIAASGTRLRRPALGAIELGYAGRGLWRLARRGRS